MSSSRSSRPSAAGGAGKKGGKKVSRAALRAVAKNSECCEDYVARLSACPSHEAIDEMADDHILLGRITKNVGCGSVQVLLQTGETVALPIGGAIRFRGRLNDSKASRPNCMLADDIVIVDGGFAAGKLSNQQVSQVRAIFSRVHYGVPKGFFCLVGESVDAAEGDDGFEFDYGGVSFGAEEETATGGGYGGGAGGFTEEDIDNI